MQRKEKICDHGGLQLETKGSPRRGKQHKEKKTETR